MGGGFAGCCWSSFIIQNESKRYYSFIILEYMKNISNISIILSSFLSSQYLLPLVWYSPVSLLIYGQVGTDIFSYIFISYEYICFITTIYLLIPPIHLPAKPDIFGIWSWYIFLSVWRLETAFFLVLVLWTFKPW